jgi:nucleotide-binding universal stress UspA family protein
MALFRRILVPHDFSAHADRALAVAAELARAHHGRLVVLNVIPPYQPVVGVPGEMMWVPPPPPVELERRRLERTVARVLGRRSPPRATCRVVVADPFRAIVDAARDADAVVMATAGRTGLSHLVIGSVAEKVVRHSPVPVLTIRPRVAVAGARRRGARRRGAATRAARRAS